MTAICQWCGAPAVGKVVVEPADVNMRTKELRKRANEADVCATHRAMVERAYQVSELDRELRRLRKRRRKVLDEHTPAIDKRIAELERRRRQLEARAA